MSDVKQAAERLRIADSYSIDIASMLTVDGLDAQLPRDLVAIMRAYLEDHLPDDDEPLTEEWLRQNGFRDKGPQYSALVCELKTRSSVWSIDWLTRFDCIQLGGLAMKHIKTRGQLRKLLAALGGMNSE